MNEGAVVKEMVFLVESIEKKTQLFHQLAAEASETLFEDSIHVTGVWLHTTTYNS